MLKIIAAIAFIVFIGCEDKNKDKPTALAEKPAVQVAEEKNVVEKSEQLSHDDMNNDSVIDSAITEASSENKYWGIENDWEGLICKEYDEDEGYTQILECTFPNANLQQVYDIVKKVYKNLRTELPITNFEDSCSQEGCMSVDFQYKSEKHLLIVISYEGGVDKIEIIENKDSTFSKMTSSLD